MKKLGEKYPSIKCRIATRPDALNKFTGSQNTETIFDIRLGTFGSFLQKSLFVIIPLRNTAYSTGHMTLLESMYRGKIILIAGVSSIRNYTDENNVFFYTPENPEDLALRAEYIYLNRETQEMKIKTERAMALFRKDYCFDAFLERISGEVCLAKFN
jgi:glycosyltransferase involved in cell wall biosynthesis